MCNQTVCLAAAAIERMGIPTVCIQLLREVAQKARPPRALFVPFRHGFPLAAPHDAQRQNAVIRAALSLIDDRSLRPGAIIDYREGGDPSIH